MEERRYNVTKGYQWMDMVEDSSNFAKLVIGVKETIDLTGDWLWWI